MTSVNENMEQLKSSASQSTENLKQGLREVGRTVSEVAHQTANDARQLGGDVIDRVSKGANEAAEHGKHQAQQFELGLEERIKQQPLTAVMASAGIGIAIGMLLRRR